MDRIAFVAALLMMLPAAGADIAYGTLMQKAPAYPDPGDSFAGYPPAWRISADMCRA